jgi:hypothetical protein
MSLRLPCFNASYVMGTEGIAKSNEIMLINTKDCEPLMDGRRARGQDNQR